MTEEIKDIAGLRREVEKLRRITLVPAVGFAIDGVINDILKLIDSLAAGYRRDAQDERIAEVLRNYIKRRVLGGGGVE